MRVTTSVSEPLGRSSPDVCLLIHARAAEPRSRASLGLGASAPLPCESRPERSVSGVEDPAIGGVGAVSTCGTMGIRREECSIPPLPDLPCWQAERAASLRAEARGIPARRGETAQRARQGSPVAKRRAQPSL